MKTKIFLFYMILCFTWQVKAQTEFAPIEAKWHYTYTFGCCPENHFNYIVFEKDTLIKEDSCKVIKQYYDNSNIASDVYILKQEQGKVYYYYQDQFNLLLDFDVKKNDTVTFTFMYKEYNNNFSLGKDTLFSARFQVEDITIDTQNLKTITTKVLEEDKLDFWGVPVPPYEYQTYSYTEKKGLHREFMPKFDNIPQTTIEEFKWLRCYSDTDFSFVSEEWATTSLPCNYSIASDINTLKDENITIYPNPTSDFFTISDPTQTVSRVEVFDVFGKKVHSQLHENKVNMSSFSTGLYVLKIYDINGKVSSFKIIKE